MMDYHGFGAFVTVVGFLTILLIQNIIDKKKVGVYTRYKLRIIINIIFYTMVAFFLFKDYVVIDNMIDVTAVTAVLFLGMFVGTCFGIITHKYQEKLDK